VVVDWRSYSLGGRILNRASLLSLLLTISIAFVAARVYQLWHTGIGDLPTVPKPKAVLPGQAADAEPPQFQVINTRNIIDKNLFDPERGATKKAEAEVQRDAQARQRIRSMILLGTAILGTSKYAIIQEPSAVRTPVQPNQRVPQQPVPVGSGQMRLKLGDTLEGFRLAEVRDKTVVFTKGAIKEEISIDFFRPGEPQPPAPTQGVPAPGAQPQPQPRPGLAPRVGARVVPPAGDQAQAAPQEAGSAVERARRALRERQLQPPQQPTARPPERPEAAPPAKPQ
jgi:hypothetical protein